MNLTAHGGFDAIGSIGANGRLVNMPSPGRLRLPVASLFRSLSGTFG